MDEHLHLPATSPETLQQALQNRPGEPHRFRKFLRRYPSRVLDQMVQELAQTVIPRIHCLNCANCCKNLEPEIRPDELIRLAEHLQTKPDILISEHLQRTQDGEAFFFRKKPCTFLNGKACSIYSDRPGSCASYPNFSRPGFRFRLDLHHHYSICPIVFSVVELLMQKLNYNPELPDNK